MIDARALRAQLGECLHRSALPGLAAPRPERVRDAYDLPGRGARLLVFTDRIPGSDETAPFRGEAAAALAAAALQEAAAVCPHALLDRPDPCALLLRTLKPLGVRVRVERGPEGVRVAALAADSVTPLDDAQARERGGALWDEARARSSALFEHGERRMRAAGLELREARLDFGEDAPGRLLLADEALTPDTTRLALDGSEIAWGVAPVRWRLLARSRRLGHARACLALAQALCGAEPELHPGAPQPRLVRNLRRTGLVA